MVSLGPVQLQAQRFGIKFIGFYSLVAFIQLLRTDVIYALQRLGHRALVASVAARGPGHFGLCGSACQANALKKYDGQAVSGKVICNREKE